MLNNELLCNKSHSYNILQSNKTQRIFDLSVPISIMTKNVTDIKKFFNKSDKEK